MKVDAVAENTVWIVAVVKSVNWMCFGALLDAQTKKSEVGFYEDHCSEWKK